METLTIQIPFRCIMNEDWQNMVDLKNKIKPENNNINDVKKLYILPRPVKWINNKYDNIIRKYVNTVSTTKALKEIRKYCGELRITNRKTQFTDLRNALIRCYNHVSECMSTPTTEDIIKCFVDFLNKNEKRILVLNNEPSTSKELDNFGKFCAIQMGIQLGGQIFDEKRKCITREWLGNHEIDYLLKEQCKHTKYCSRAEFLPTGLYDSIYKLASIAKLRKGSDKLICLIFNTAKAPPGEHWISSTVDSLNQSITFYCSCEPMMHNGIHNVLFNLANELGYTMHMPCVKSQKADADCGIYCLLHVYYVLNGLNSTLYQILPDTNVAETREKYYNLFKDSDTYNKVSNNE